MPREIPVFVIGVGSNLIVRDGGLRGLVIRLGGKAFGTIEATAGHRVIAGAAALDAQVARVAPPPPPHSPTTPHRAPVWREANVDGLAFLRGVPGAIGGALRMNAGAHGGEVRDILLEAHGLDRDLARSQCVASPTGRNPPPPKRWPLAVVSYNVHSEAPEDVIFTRAIFQGRAGERAAILAEMERITAAREASQPIREKTGGSTFKNPPGEKAWRLIDAAGCRWLLLGLARAEEIGRLDDTNVPPPPPPQPPNPQNTPKTPAERGQLINRDNATAADIEALGEEVPVAARQVST